MRRFLKRLVIVSPGTAAMRGNGLACASPAAPGLRQTHVDRLRSFEMVSGSVHDGTVSIVVRLSDGRGSKARASPHGCTTPEGATRSSPAIRILQHVAFGRSAPVALAVARTRFTRWRRAGAEVARGQVCTIARIILCRASWHARQKRSPTDFSCQQGLRSSSCNAISVHCVATQRPVLPVGRRRLWIRILVHRMDFYRR